VDAVNVALQLAFIAIFVVVLVRFVRQPRAVHRDLVLVFGTVVALFGFAIARRLWPDLPQALTQAGGIAILLQPYLTLHLASHFVPVSRRVATGALVWLVAASVAIVVGTRGNPGLTMFVVAYFVAVELGAGVLLLRASRRRVGYARTRLRIAAAATLLFAAGILVSGTGSALAPSGATTDPSVLVLSRLLTLTAGIGYLAAFLPPKALRRLQQRAVAFDIGQVLLGSPLEGDQDRIWVALAQAARTITNGTVSIVTLGDPPIVRVVSGEPPTGVIVGDAYPGPTIQTGRDDHPPTRIIVPIESDLARQGWLIADPDVGSLFIEDDVVLLGLLAAQAARANERREAIRQSGVLASELEDASLELATSRAQLEAEARFRAALEAHPGILLVTEPNGRLGYANGQALRSLGYGPTEIGELWLDEVLIRSPDASAHGSGEARRRDGTTIPVEYAVSTFEAEGEPSSIAVLTDISDRIEKDHLRDTFIGVLSHELRTPVTAIYGGSQVLLSRGEQLDRAVASELLADIAAEAERLHRLIEDLLILARSERGEGIVGGEPVLLQHILPSIVERERTLWLGTDIAATIPLGLPTVTGNEAYVGQVIRNLISNAVKYGGPEATVRIVAEGGGDGVAIRVLDDGPGLAPATVGHLFDLYYRAPGAASTATGAGIGLYVCREIVAALGGTIWARQRPEGGAEFGFRLPIYEADDEASAPFTGDGELATAS
jgi:signal transduction histidine kinase